MTRGKNGTKEIVRRIKEKKWGNSLTRTGFLQPKIIAIGALMLPVKLAKGIIAKMDGYLWVNDFVTYSQGSIDSFSPLFKKAFKFDPKWPLLIIKDLEKLSKKKDLLVKRMKSKIKNISQAADLFSAYVNLLQEIMKYYVIAVPLTDYCEDKLNKLEFKYSDFAVAFKKLDIDLYHQSLEQIIESTGKVKESIIKKHLKNFAWIKTAYNIIDSYIKDDLLEALKNPIIESDHKPLPANHPPVLIGLQSGIYMRNRMKELVQQLWFAFDPVAKYLANYLSFSREEFLTLTPSEVFELFAFGTSKIFREQIEVRQKGFVAGFIDEKLILLTGDLVYDLFNFFNPGISKNILEFKGNVACNGRAKGIVKIIKTKNDFSKFSRGEILVAPMTTPDFILIMKKSSAIVTDEGGLSSHAAIVSRELGVPAIIGTKIATKVLHDGDLVEVDADKGVVKIIRKYEAKLR